MQDSHHHHHQSNRKQSEASVSESPGADADENGWSGTGNGNESGSKPRRVSVQPEDAELEVNLYVHFDVFISTVFFIYTNSSMPLTFLLRYVNKDTSIIKQNKYYQVIIFFFLQRNEMKMFLC